MTCQLLEWLPINHSRRRRRRRRRNNEGGEKNSSSDTKFARSSTLLEFRVTAITTAFCLLEGKETERERESEEERLQLRSTCVRKRDGHPAKKRMNEDGRCGGAAGGGGGDEKLSGERGTKDDEETMEEDGQRRK